MSEREQILSGIRSALGVKAGDLARAEAVAARLSAPPSGTVPSRVANRKDWLPLFEERLTAQSGKVSRAADGAEALALIEAYLKGLQMPLRLRIGTDSRLAALPWALMPDLERLTGPVTPEDCAGLSHAFAGAAETGTLVLVSGPENPTRINFLPETHIVLIAEDDILGSYEACWSRLRARYGAGSLPRTVNWISGPSRTADIEQTIINGAHGPKNLHAVIVKRP